MSLSDRFIIEIKDYENEKQNIPHCRNSCTIQSKNGRKVKRRYP